MDASKTLWEQTWTLVNPQVLLDLAEGLNMEYICGLRPNEMNPHHVQNALLNNLAGLETVPSVWDERGRLVLAADIHRDAEMLIWHHLAHMHDEDWITRISKTEIRNTFWSQTTAVQNGSCFDVQLLLIAISWWMLHPEHAGLPTHAIPVEVLMTTMHRYVEDYLELTRINVSKAIPAGVIGYATLGA